MPNTININAETGANLIGDDAEPTLQISNTSTGAGLKVDTFVATGAATVAQVNLTPAIPAANATIVGINLSTPSRASGAVFNLKGQSYVSAVSIIFAAGAGWAGMGGIRVVRSDGTFGWIPVLPAAQFTAAAVE